MMRGENNKIEKGDTFKVSVADGYAHYKITKVNARTVAYVLDADADGGDGYMDAILLDKGTVGKGKVGPLIAAEKMWSDLAQKGKDEKGSLALGEVIHYNNGFKAYVRGVVAPLASEDSGKGFKPVALVGEWSAHELPRRGKDGEIYHPFHAERIRREDVSPIPNCVAELDANLPPAELAVIKALPAISLEVAPLSDEEAKKASLFKSVDKAGELLANAKEGDPKAALEAARDYINAILK